MPQRRRVTPAKSLAALTDPNPRPGVRVATRGERVQAPVTRTGAIYLPTGAATSTAGRNQSRGAAPVMGLVASGTESAVITIPRGPIPWARCGPSGPNPPGRTHQLQGLIHTLMHVQLNRTHFVTLG